MITIIPQLPALFISDELCYTENIAKIDTMEGKNLCPSSACFLSPPASHHCHIVFEVMMIRSPYIGFYMTVSRIH